MSQNGTTTELEQPWWYEGPCPECGKAVADTGDEMKCVGCGLSADTSELSNPDQMKQA
jgi:tRNA(Ile2) C34 agmatinyltransferase TiaS